MSTYRPQVARLSHAGDAARSTHGPRAGAAIALVGAMALVLGLAGCWDDDSTSAPPTYSVGGSVEWFVSSSGSRFEHRSDRVLMTMKERL